MSSLDGCGPQLFCCSRKLPSPPSSCPNYGRLPFHRLLPCHILKLGSEPDSFFLLRCLSRLTRLCSCICVCSSATLSYSVACCWAQRTFRRRATWEGVQFPFSLFHRDFGDVRSLGHFQGHTAATRHTWTAAYFEHFDGKSMRMSWLSTDFSELFPPIQIFPQW